MVEGDHKARAVQDLPVYAAMVRELDETVATVLAAVEKSGSRDKTLVIFTSDNGGLSTAEGSPTSNLPLRAGKGYVYEGGIRVPLIVRWPGIVKPGTTTDVPTTTLDVPATLLDAAGVKPPVGVVLDGVSLRSVLADTGQILTRLWFLDARALQLLSQLLLGGRCRRVCLGLMLWVLLLGLQCAGLRRRLGHGSVFVGAGRRCRRTMYCRMLHFSIYVFLTPQR